jgi:undecaprenyl-diphosphatase
MVLEVALLGILQGVLEWLPVSSQGNLVLLMIHLLGIEPAQALNLSLFLHIGTSLAALIYYRTEFIALLKATPHIRSYDNRRERRLLVFLLTTTLMTGLVGYMLLRLLFTSTLIGETLTGLTGVALIGTGLVQRASHERGTRSTVDLTAEDMVVAGLTQGFAAIPGVSRSGVTITALLFRQFRARAALKLSFLMSVPVVLAGEVGLTLLTGLPAVAFPELLVGILASFTVGLVSIHSLIKLTAKVKVWTFCLVLGMLALLPLFSYLL